MTLRDLLIGVPLVGDCTADEMEISSINWDSRTVQPGGLFVVLPERRTNGQNYAAQAVERGASVIISETPGEYPVPCLPVRDAEEALARLSCNWFQNPGDELVLVAVTGTNGKTTTTSLLKELLERTLHTKVGLIGTNRNLIGDRELPARNTTPESYHLQALLRQMADEGCTHAVMEVSSHALMQRRTAGLTFDVGVFTNLTQDHLDYHRTMEEYRAAKQRLFAQCTRAVLNLDDETGRWYRDRIGIPTFTYSENNACADLTARNIRLFPGAVEFEAVQMDGIARVHLPIPGGFTIYNALAALSAGLCLGLDLTDMAARMPAVRGVKGRVEIVPVPAVFTVLIDYAHSPNALENILMTAREFTAGRLICLFGCGGDRDKTKRPLMGAIAEELADVMVVTSDNPRTEDPEAILRDILSGMSDEALCHVEPDRRRAIGWALEQAGPGDVIVLAGKGHETYQEIGRERFPLDERAVVARWFREKENRIRQERTGFIPPVGV